MNSEQLIKEGIKVLKLCEPETKLTEKNISISSVGIDQLVKIYSEDEIKLFLI